MDDQIESLVNPLEDLGGGQGSLAGVQLIDKGQDLLGELVGLLWSPLLRQ
jgi:hypothetical protein